jgi:pimeloyl-ACP methyl ester carboxylesterase
MHPRLFAAVVALEPFLVPGGSEGQIAGVGLGFVDLATHAMARRRDVWGSREEARTAMLRIPYFAAFDKDVFELVVKHDLRPTGRGDEVTLVTPKAMEVATMMRMVDKEKGRLWSDYTGDKSLQILKAFYRSEPFHIARKLPEVRPPVLYVFATESVVRLHGYPEWLLDRTGTGEMGSGGVKKDKVNLVWIKGAGHPMPLEKPRETAEAMVPWIKKQIQRWVEESEMDAGEFNVTKINPTWMEKLEKL